MNLTYQAGKLKNVFLMVAQNIYFAWKKCIHRRRNNSIIFFPVKNKAFIHKVHLP